MQFRVPQNIAMEDRIAGPLTAIQFSILVVGGMVSFLVFTSLTIPNPLNKAFGALLGLITFTLAVGKFNDQPMYRFFRFIIAFVTRPRTRVWHKGGAEVQLIKPNQHKQDDGPRVSARQLSKAELASLANVLDSRGQQGMLPKPAPKEVKGKK